MTTSLTELRALTNAAEAADGAAGWDEATWLALEHRPESVRVLSIGGSGRPLEGVALITGHDLALVVHPDFRRQGIGRQLLEQAMTVQPGLREAWSHGNHPAAAALAASTGWQRVRDLWVMRRPTADPLAAVAASEDVVIRSFQPGDEAELVRVNAAAFAAHPEQGAMDAANLAERMASQWFDPAGLLLAFDANDPSRLLGLHWTKVHPAPTDRRGHQRPAVGEVYVVGIDPSAQGRGLGKLLTNLGLAHLAEQVGPDSEVLLYVESDNAPALAVYSGLGFSHAAADTHVLYARSAAPASS